MKVYQSLIAFFVIFWCVSCIQAQQQDTTATTGQDLSSSIAEHNVSILVYHHVSTSTPAITSISPAKFKEHLKYIAANHNVIALDKAIMALQQQTPLPVNSVVITFDDGYSNIYENAYPLLKEFNFPFTIFINPDQIGRFNSQLTWQQVNAMQPLATFANHTLEHIHMLNRLPEENEDQWLVRVTDNVKKAERMLEEKVGYSKQWLAYPFGEYNNTLKSAIREAGYIGFAQHSGAASPSSDLAAIPRFPAAGIYANLNTLQVKMRSLDMPVTNVIPANPELEHKTSLKTVGFTLKDNQDLRVSQLACYFGGESIAVEKDNMNVRITLPKSLKVGRSRVNCTAPSNSLTNRFYWHSIPMFVPDESGRFID